MRDYVIGLIKRGSQEMYERHGHVSPWRLSRNIHIAAGVINVALKELGYVEEGQGNFVLKKAQGKAKAKEPKRLEDTDISSFKISNDMELPTQDFIQQDWEEIDYTAYTLNELRSIASKKGIEVALSMTKGELIEKLKSWSKLNG